MTSCWRSEQDRQTHFKADVWTHPRQKNVLDTGQNGEVRRVIGLSNGLSTRDYISREFGEGIWRDDKNACYAVLESVSIGNRLAMTYAAN